MSSRCSSTCGKINSSNFSQPKPCMNQTQAKSVLPSCAEKGSARGRPSCVGVPAPGRWETGKTAAGRRLHGKGLDFGRRSGAARSAAAVWWLLAHCRESAQLSRFHLLLLKTSRSFAATSTLPAGHPTAPNFQKYIVCHHRGAFACIILDLYTVVNLEQIVGGVQLTCGCIELSHWGANMVEI